MHIEKYCSETVQRLVSYIFSQSDEPRAIVACERLSLSGVSFAPNNGIKPFNLFTCGMFPVLLEHHNFPSLFLPLSQLWERGKCAGIKFRICVHKKKKKKYHKKQNNKFEH